MSDTATPRTDAARISGCNAVDGRDYVPISVARQLERELAATDAQRVRAEMKAMHADDMLAGAVALLLEHKVAIGSQELITASNDVLAKRDNLEMELVAANERIRRLEEVSWRPIESAPHDMTWVIGYDGKDGECGTIIFDRVVESCDSHEEQCHYEWTDGMRKWTPTHWMPLPEIPKAKEAKP
jgi:hypothetical protein